MPHSPAPGTNNANNNGGLCPISRRVSQIKGARSRENGSGDTDWEGQRKMRSVVEASSGGGVSWTRESKRNGGGDGRGVGWERSSGWLCPDFAKL